MLHTVSHKSDVIRQGGGCWIEYACYSTQGGVWFEVLSLKLTDDGTRMTQIGRIESLGFKVLSLRFDGEYHFR